MFSLYLDLDVATGYLYWKRRDIPGALNSRFEGKRAGADKGRGYRVVRVNGKSYMEHRVIFEMVYGAIPEGMCVDHINGIRSDNRPSNLQLASNTENVRKRHVLNVNNTSGEIGVRWLKAAKKWMARIKVNRRSIYLGIFKDIKEAKEARRNAEVKYFKNYHSRIDTL